MITALTGNGAAAQGFKAARVGVYAGYPITPSTGATEDVVRMINDGELAAEWVRVESEHSAMSAVIGAAASTRAGTSTSSKGLLYMLEVMGNASGGAFPAVVYLGNRATGEPINILGDNSDAYFARDTGAIQLFSKNAQEVFDNLVQAYKIAEHAGVRLPVLVNALGFTITHALERVELPGQDAVDAYLPPYVAMNPTFDPANPITIGTMLSDAPYRRHKRNQHAFMEASREVIVAEGEAFGRRFGRSYGLFEWIGDAQAELVVIQVGGFAGTGEVVVNHLRGRDGIPGIAILNLRVFTPFPAAEVAAALDRSGAKAVAVIDQGMAHGAVGAPLLQRVATAVQRHGARPGLPIVGVIGGLGGSQISYQHFQDVFNLLENVRRGRAWRREPYWLDILEDPLLRREGTPLSPLLERRYADVYREQEPLAAFQEEIRPAAREGHLIGRAGQGAITTAAAATTAGIVGGDLMFMLPQFGSERRGAQMNAKIVRSLGSDFVRSASGRPDTVLVFDPSLLRELGKQNLAATLRPNARVLVNTSEVGTDRVRELLGLGPEVEVLVVPAARIAQEVGLGKFFNMVLLGAWHRLQGDSEEALEQAITAYYAANVPAPRDRNLEAIRQGYRQSTAQRTAPAARDRDSGARARKMGERYREAWSEAWEGEEGLP